jgi:RNA polymerase sigma-70 factor (ECF subfamily)
MGPPTDVLATFLAEARGALVVLARAHLDRRLWPKLDPEDLAQQTLQEAWADEGRLRDLAPGPRAAWLRRALLHNVFDAVRRLRRQKCDPRLERALDRSSDRLADSLAGSDSTPSQRAARREELARLAEALTRLPRDQQDAVILHHLQGLKLAEVAEHLGRSLPAVAGLVHRGLTRLHALLREADPHA